MPSATRSSSSAIRFPSSKQAVQGGASKSSKPDAITLLFRREVQSLLSTVPALPSHIAPDTPVEVVACVERLSLSGIQQSVQLCQAGDETWVTRTEGARQYFPRAGRVQKRLRGSIEDDDDHPEDERDEPEDDVDRSRRTERVTIRKKKSKKSHHHDSRSSFETPRAVVASTSSSASSSTRRRSDPTRAPQKKKKERHHRHHDRGRDEDQDELDDGASTETELSHLASRTRRRSESTEMLTSFREEETGGGGGASAGLEPLGRGQRRCSGRNATPQRAASSAPSPSPSSASPQKVKTEDGDDLASLCGRVGGLEFRSTVDPESEWEQTPAPTSTNAKGKERA